MQVPLHGVGFRKSYPCQSHELYGDHHASKDDRVWSQRVHGFDFHQVGFRPEHFVGICSTFRSRNAYANSDPPLEAKVHRALLYTHMHMCMNKRLEKLVHQISI